LIDKFIDRAYPHRISQLSTPSLTYRSQTLAQTRTEERILLQIHAISIALEVLFERCGEIELVPGVALEAIINPLGYGIKRVPITFRRR